jgi:hypothetical protein
MGCTEMSKAMFGCIWAISAVAAATCASPSDFNKETPEDRLGELEAQLPSAEGPERVYVLGKAARAAISAGETLKAERYATEALEGAADFPNDWNYGNAIHHANLVLGHVALARGDVKGAVARLIEAGQTPGSPQLDTFGPNMALAKELLELGETDAVLEYLEETRRFWEHPEKIDRWQRAIREGGIPDFGANLRY